MSLSHCCSPSLIVEGSGALRRKVCQWLPKGSPRGRTAPRQIRLSGCEVKALLVAQESATEARQKVQAVSSKALGITESQNPGSQTPRICGWSPDCVLRVVLAIAIVPT